MRGARRLLTSAVLLVALLVGALAFSVPGAVVFRFVWPDGLWRWFVPVSFAVAAVFDMTGFRGLHVGRQVPQAWGHRNGPVAAAARYGLRLGVAPATILTTWVWWAGWLASSFASPIAAVVFAGSFAVTRWLTMVGLAGWGTVPLSGPAMSRRIAWVVRLQQRVRAVGLCCVVLSALVST